MQPLQPISIGSIGPSAQITGATTSFSAMPSGLDNRSFNSPIGQRWLAAISQATGLSQGDIQGQLQNGGDVKDILQSKNVTMSDVRQALRSQAGKVQHSGHHRGHGAAAAGTQDAEAAFAGAVAATLGMSVSDLQQQLSSGVGLDQLAARQGVSQQTLDQTIRQTFQQLTGYTAQGAPGTTAASTGQVDQAA